MTHERARFFLTLIGVITPIIALGCTLAIFLWGVSYAILGLLIFFFSLILIMADKLDLPLLHLLELR
jgi:hypothetical protein